jgi:hypothetical protein
MSAGKQTLQGLEPSLTPAQPATTAGPDRTETRRLDWLLGSPGTRCEPLDAGGGVFMETWVCNGAPGNEEGGGGMFFVVGATSRECIDKFLVGDITSSNA